MPVQTTYNSAPDIGYEGQLIQAAMNGIHTFWSEDGVYPGRGCAQGTATSSTAGFYNDRNIPFGVKLPDDSGDVIIGIPILTANLPNDANGAPYYPDMASAGKGHLVPVLKEGSIWAIAGEAVAVRDPVYTVYTIGDSGLSLGSLCKDATPGTTGAALLIPNAYWATAGAAGAIAKVVMGSDPEI